MKKSILQYWLIEPSVLTERSKAKYIRYILRYLLHWKYNYAWVQYLNSSCNMLFWKQKYGCDIYLKTQQSLISNHLSVQQKYEYLTEHYDWFFEKFSAQIIKNNELLLWSSQIEIDGEMKTLEMFFSYKGPFVTEGECALVLKLNGGTQYTISFLHILQSSEAAFFIGGLQAGTQNVTCPELLKKMTKSLYGLRPKQFMLHAISEFAHFFNVNNLIGVSNANHAFQGSRSKSKRARVKTNLDEFWLDFSPELTIDGNFYFRPLLSVIDLEQIPSKKRSQYRKRQLILDDFVQQLQSNLSAIK